MVVRPNDSVRPARENKNYHSGGRLLNTMQDSCNLAVFNTRTVDAAGVPSEVRVAYGRRHLWPNKSTAGLRKVHKNMFHAVANAMNYTSVHPDGDTGRVPTKRRRAQAVGVLGDDYHVPALGDSDDDDTRSESDGSYEGEPDDDASDASV